MNYGSLALKREMTVAAAVTLHHELGDIELIVAVTPPFAIKTSPSARTLDEGVRSPTRRANPLTFVLLRTQPASIQFTYRSNPLRRA